MKDLGITKGEWSYNTWEHQTDPSMRIGAKGTPMLCQVPSEFVSYNEQRANVKLIVDAGNTAQKCGLLPSELFEEVEQLRRWKKEQIEVVSPLLDAMQKRPGLKIGVSMHNEAINLLEQRDEMRKCISKFADYIRCNATGGLKNGSFHQRIVDILEKTEK